MQLLVLRPFRVTRALAAALAICLGALPGAAHALDKITLQLKHKHQFQFAGYYAAKELGYYRDAGLDVTLREGGDGNQPERDVIAGRAHYGVGSSSLLLARAAGKPLVVLGVIFQHSPYVLLMARGSGMTVSDLRGKRVMIGSLTDELTQADEVVAYLKKENIFMSEVVRVEHTFNPQDLVTGKVDAMSAYATNEHPGTYP